MIAVATASVSYLAILQRKPRRLFLFQIFQVNAIMKMNFMRKLESKIKEFLVERGWDKLRPSDLAKSISIEAAELLEVFQWTSIDIEETKRDAQRMEDIKKELADVFIYAIEMAVLLNLDVEEVVKSKLEQVEKKYPAELMRKNAKAGSGSGADPKYWKIKNSARRSKNS